MKSRTSAEEGREISSQRERARELRRKAYREAKERRASDPRFVALQLKVKEEAKRRRKEAYRQLKERKRAAVLAERGQAGEGRQLKRRAAARELAPPGCAAQSRLDPEAMIQNMLPLPGGESVDAVSKSAQRSRRLVELMAKVRLATERGGAANDAVSDEG